MNHKITNTKNTINLAIWTSAWLISSAISKFGPILVWTNDYYTAGSVILTIIVGILMLMANVRYLNGLDELQRKIHLEAFSWALGIGIIVGLGYAQLGNTGLISEENQVPFLVVLMSLTYLSAVFVGRYRYS